MTPRQFRDTRQRIPAPSTRDDYRHGPKHPWPSYAELAAMLDRATCTIEAYACGRRAVPEPVARTMRKLAAKKSRK